jgi:uncharacterized membrane protein
MGKNRLEAFSDGVTAIIITIIVLELKVPHCASFDDLLPVLPVLSSYILSFIYIGINWNQLQYGSYPTATKKHASRAPLPGGQICSQNCLEVESNS